MPPGDASAVQPPTPASTPTPAAAAVAVAAAAVSATAAPSVPAATAAAAASSSSLPADFPSAPPSASGSADLQHRQFVFPTTATTEDGSLTDPVAGGITPSTTSDDAGAAATAAVADQSSAGEGLFRSSPMPTLFMQPTDPGERKRLHVQHIMFRKLFSGLFHTPQRTILEDPALPATVLDVGCAPGDRLSRLCTAAGLQDVQERVASFPIGWNGPVGKLCAADFRQGYLGALKSVLQGGRDEAAYEQLVADAMRQAEDERIFLNAYSVFGRVEK
ncbi:hypothetical protein HK405_013390 [Cladochytrium tenue]|nr:hypothetical protein HK405_013390 [Cladochytrium tenue]